MARDLGLMDLSALALGGKDGGMLAAASAAVAGVKCHVIEVLEDSATFTLMTAENQDGSARNMLSANGYDSVVLAVGTLVYAPFGGFISAFTCDKATRRFTLPDSNRLQNNT